MNHSTVDPSGFDTSAAITRSMLGWGVLAGPVYLVVGVLLAVTRDGFRLTEHQLSLLMVGDHGRLQTANLIGSGALCGIAAVGLLRAASRDGTSPWPGRLVGGFALGLVGSGLFEADPMAGFPPGAETDTTTSGLLHVAFGALQFACLVGACLAAARWAGGRGDARRSRCFRVAGGVVLVGFVGGAALSQTPVGVLFLWVAVVVGYAWLAIVSAYAWTTVPHPDADRRPPGPA